MKENIVNLSLLLQNILEARKTKNKRYSMRALARDINISPGRLSNILNNKYIPGQTTANRILETIIKCQEERQDVLRIIEQTLKQKKMLDGTHQIMEAEFSVVSDWHHFAILNLMETDNYRQDAKWIAKRLNLDEITVTNSLNTLLMLGLVKLNEENKLVPTHKNITTTHDVPSEVLRESQRQSIEKSLHSLQLDPPDLRDITSISLPINIENIPKAKEMAREFRRKVATLLEEGDKTEVYSINVQIFPLTRG